MAILTPPWMQGASYSAKNDRFASRAEDWDEGVNDRTALKVTQRAAGANLTLDVAAGDAIVQGDDQVGQGNYPFRNDAVFNLAGFSAATGSNLRYDLVVARINDPDAGGAAGSTGTIERVAGTQAASGSAAPPAVPNSCLLLAVVGPFTSSTSSITNSMVYDCWSTGVPSLAASAASVARLLRGHRDPTGTIVDTVNSVAPNGWAVMAGQTLAVSGIGARLAEHLPGQVSTGNVTVPDARGRTTVAMDNQGGTDAGRLTSSNSVLTAGGEEAHTLTYGEMPAHQHTGMTGGETAAHQHNYSGTTSGQTADHVHGAPAGEAGLVSASEAAGFSMGNGGALQLNTHYGATGGTSNDHQHNYGGTTSTETAAHQHPITTDVAGGSGAHNNMPPFLTVYKIIRL